VVIGVPVYRHVDVVGNRVALFLGQLAQQPGAPGWPADLRVAIIGTGHLSLELGGPRQFGPHGPDPEFDRKAVEWIASGDIEKALGEVSLQALWEPGNATHGFLDFMLMMGTAGAGREADYTDTLDLFHTMEAYFTWYPNGVPAISGEGK
jgi:protocatechuate 4,5-dioxygenase beta chain